jgi:hypothetical protein
MDRVQYLRASVLPCCRFFSLKPLIWSGGPRQISPHERYQTSVFEWDRQFRLVRVHYQHREEHGRLRLAGVGADDVAVAEQTDEVAYLAVDLP